jgi:hypothetical protein
LRPSAGHEKSLGAIKLEAKTTIIIPEAYRVIVEVKPASYLGAHCTKMGALAEVVPNRTALPEHMNLHFCI